MNSKSVRYTTHTTFTVVYNMIKSHSHFIKLPRACYVKTVKQSNVIGPPVGVALRNDAIPPSDCPTMPIPLGFINLEQKTVEASNLVKMYSLIVTFYLKCAAYKSTYLLTYLLSRM